MEIFEPLWPFEGHAKASCLDLIPDFDSNTTKLSFSYCWTIQRWTWWCVSDRNSSALERQRMNWCLIFSTRMCWKVPSVSYPGHLQATWVLPAVVDSIYGSAVWGTFLWSYGEAVSAFFLPLLGLFNFSQLPVSVDRTSHAVLVTDDSSSIYLMYLQMLCGSDYPHSCSSFVHGSQSLKVLDLQPLWGAFMSWNQWQLWSVPAGPCSPVLEVFICDWPSWILIMIPIGLWDFQPLIALVFVLFCLSRILFLNSLRKLSSALSAHWRKRYLLAKVAMS